MLISTLNANSHQDVSLVSHFQEYLVNDTFTDTCVSVLQKNLRYSIRQVTKSHT